MRNTSSCRFLALLGSALLSGCAAMGGADDHTLARTRSEGAIEGRPTLGIPIALPGHTTCLIPFSLETRKWMFQDSDPYTRGGGASAGYLSNVFYPGDCPAPGGSVRWHNAIVSDLAKGDQWMILSERGVIARWRVLGRTPPSGEPFRGEAIVFIATLDDSNHDGLLDDLDASMAIVADGDGRNPRIVTPRTAQVWDFSFDEENSRLYLLVVADTNADGRFSTQDAPVPFVLGLRDHGPAAPAVGDDLRRRAEALLR